MKIGLDAKRIFNNKTGLGVYGRNLVSGFEQITHPHQFYLFTPTAKSEIYTPSKHFNVVSSHSFSSYYWRTFSIAKDIKNNNLDIYHGLSNELPLTIAKTKVKSIVDIHDLCFVKFKEDYSKIDQQIFWYKAKNAALQSHKIIATSNATKQDILQYFKVPENKVEVVYQCCDKQFYAQKTKEEIDLVIKKYNLPKEYFLSVGTIQGRKNQQAIVKAISKLDKAKQLPLVLVGNGGKYLQQLKALAQQLNVKLFVLDNLPFNELPCIYQNAKVFVYPSFIEGFGIPVLEAMAAKTPVVTTKNTSMAEIIQDENNLISADNIEEIAEKMSYFLVNPQFANTEKHYTRALDFSEKKFAQQVLDIYEKLQ